jgi:hypothetical protein
LQPAMALDIDQADQAHPRVDTWFCFFWFPPNCMIDFVSPESGSLWMANYSFFPSASIFRFLCKAMPYIVLKPSFSAIARHFPSRLELMPPPCSISEMVAKHVSPLIILYFGFTGGTFLANPPLMIIRIRVLPIEAGLNLNCPSPNKNDGLLFLDSTAVTLMGSICDPVI